MYYALYRKWRPKVFSDVIDQEYIVKTLQSQVKNNKLSHAYIFTGSRGTGKTTCAKILAKAVNCLDIRDGNPCNECKICKGIDSGSILDVLEIDAASNNGIENIRDLREEANFTPTVGKYRVYIIDEVHMLSIGAFNALLKIMEEPPRYVIFILATTEINKVPETILSRCQQFNFNKISQKSIIEKLMFISESENIRLDEKAATIIARYADGGLRDALSILDSCISYTEDGKVDTKTVSKVVSIADISDIVSIAKCILNKNVQMALTIIEDITSRYIDPFKLMSQLINIFKDIMITKVSGEEILNNIDVEVLKQLKILADNISIDNIVNIMDILTDSYNKISRSSYKQLELELSIIKIIYFDSNHIDSTNDDKLNNMIIDLNNKINLLNTEVMMLKTQINNGDTSIRLKEDNDVVSADDKLLCEKAQEIFNWNEILDILLNINPALYAALKDSKGYLNKEAEIVFIETDNPFFLELIRSSVQAKQTLKQSIWKVLGKKYRIGPYKVDKTDKGSSNMNFIDDIEKLAKENNIKLNIK